MVSVYDVDATALINKLAERLASEIEVPAWAKFVKTGSHKERPPLQKNWWYIRAAAILRTIYKNGPVGISKLRSKYGGAKNRGRSPHKFRKGSGKVIRTIVQQLEEKGYLKRAEKGKGRLIASLGQSMLEKVASDIYVKHSKPVAAVKPVVSKVKITTKVVKKKEVKKPSAAPKAVKKPAVKTVEVKKTVTKSSKAKKTVKKEDKK